MANTPLPNRKYLGLCLILGISGCQTPLESAIDPVSTPDPEEQLLGVATSIEGALKTLAEANKIEVPPALDTDPLLSPQAGLNKSANIDWSGPIQPFIQRIADLTQYHLKIFGPMPEIPVIVSITGKHILLADALKDAGLQAGKRAVVMVFPESRIIELRYARM